MSPILYSLFAAVLVLLYIFHGYPMFLVNIPFPVFLTMPAVVIVIFGSLALVHFIFPNRYTEPFLVMLPIIVLALLFEKVVYSFALILFINVHINDLSFLIALKQTCKFFYTDMYGLPKLMSFFCIPLLVLYCTSKYAKKIELMTCNRIKNMPNKLLKRN